MTGAKKRTFKSNGISSHSNEANCCKNSRNQQLRWHCDVIIRPFYDFDKRTIYSQCVYILNFHTGTKTKLKSFTKHKLYHLTIIAEIFSRPDFSILTKAAGKEPTWFPFLFRRRKTREIKVTLFLFSPPLSLPIHARLSRGIVGSQTNVCMGGRRGEEK